MKKHELSYCEQKGRKNIPPKGKMKAKKAYRHIRHRYIKSIQNHVLIKQKKKFNFDLIVQQVTNN